MEKGDREERKEEEGGEEIEKEGNGSGPDQVREENDARVYTPMLLRI